MPWPLVGHVDLDSGIIVCGQTIMQTIRTNALPGMTLLVGSLIETPQGDHGGIAPTLMVNRMHVSDRTTKRPSFTHRHGSWAHCCYHAPRLPSAGSMNPPHQKRKQLIGLRSILPFSGWRRPGPPRPGCASRRPILPES